MKLLSLRLCAHDSNIAYFDGERVRYYKSERDFGVKHHAFNNLWEWKDVVKRVWGLDYNDLDEIALIIEPTLYNLPRSDSFFPAIEFDNFPAKCKVWRIDHHYAHSLSYWMVDSREPDIVFVIDGCGDGVEHESNGLNTWSVFKHGTPIQRGRLELELGRYTDHFGRLMGYMGAELGLQGNVLDFPGKVMSLQNYGNVDAGYMARLSDATFERPHEFFNIDRWHTYKGGVNLGMHSKLDWARTVHTKSGEVILDFFKKHAKQDDVIFYVGGVAQNIVWNTMLRDHFPNLVIGPHCGDEGLSLGGLEWLRIKNNLPKFTLPNFPYCQSDSSADVSDATIKDVAKRLANGQSVGWYQGNGEIGPRALGNRSILLDPRIPNGKDKINATKQRENFRPFGASCLAEYASDHFKINYPSPYMLYTFEVTDPTMHSITHVDGTCRLQTVSDDTPFRRLLQEFHSLTGCPVLLNTSLNVNGKPIMGDGMNEILTLYSNSPLDCIVHGDYVMGR